jgi:hypothetical protein
MSTFRAYNLSLNKLWKGLYKPREREGGHLRGIKRYSGRHGGSLQLCENLRSSIQFSIATGYGRIIYSHRHNNEDDHGIFHKGLAE